MNRKVGSTYGHIQLSVIDINVTGTDALPRPPPAPVTTTVCPLNERVISKEIEVYGAGVRF